MQFYHVREQRFTILTIMIFNKGSNIIYNCIYTTKESIQKWEGKKAQVMFYCLQCRVILHIIHDRIRDTQCTNAQSEYI